MADVKKSEQEPSIEEILESIRQIISDEDEQPQPADAHDDEPAPVAAKPQPKPQPRAPEPEPVADDDILDLTEPAAEEEHIDMVARTVEEEKPVPPSPPPAAPRPAQQPPATDAAMTDKPNSLLSEQAAAAATQELSKLMAGNMRIEREGASPAGKVTLEDIAIELMRPMIKEWMDQNLPAVIEKMVAREIEKLSRRASDI